MPFGFTGLIDSVDYHQFAKSHTVGLGFELLALNNSNKGDITSVRNFIADKIKDGKKEFNSALHIDRSLAFAKQFKYLFSSLIVLKANEEYHLKQRLINSIDEPTALIVSKENIYKFEDLFASPNY